MSFTGFAHQATTSLAGSAVAIPNYLLAHGLSKERMLFAMVFACCFLAIIAVKVRMTNPVFVMLTFGSVGLTAIGIECNVSLSENIYDVGHELLSPLREWGDQNPHINVLFASLNSLLCGFIGIYSVFTCIAWGRRQCLAKGSVGIFLRMIIGLSTRLPVPKNVVLLDGDWPPSNDNCTGFIFNPSGHVLAATLVSMDLRRLGMNKYAFLLDVLNILQAARLISLQGHYTVDVITSLLLAYVVDPYVEDILAKMDGESGDGRKDKSE